MFGHALQPRTHLGCGGQEVFPIGALPVPRVAHGRVQCFPEQVRRRFDQFELVEARRDLGRRDVSQVFVRSDLAERHACASPAGDGGMRRVNHRVAEGILVSDRIGREFGGECLLQEESPPSAGA